MTNDDGIVYSTEHGRMCPKCNKQAKFCICKKVKNLSKQEKQDGVVRVRKETKGRKGKGVTTISGIPLNIEEVKKLAKALKTKCGTGGTVKDGIIEIQGDHCVTVIAELQKKGWIVKKAGG